MALNVSVAGDMPIFVVLSHNWVGAWLQASGKKFGSPMVGYFRKIKKIENWSQNREKSILLIFF